MKLRAVTYTQLNSKITYNGAKTAGGVALGATGALLTLTGVGAVVTAIGIGGVVVSVIQAVKTGRKKFFKQFRGTHTLIYLCF
jgi:hypothetical protein